MGHNQTQEGGDGRRKIFTKLIRELTIATRVG
jgi:transcriptional/translational regulatory protein YebC/TACO1